MMETTHRTKIQSLTQSSTSIDILNDTQSTIESNTNQINSIVLSESKQTLKAIKSHRLHQSKTLIDLLRHPKVLTPLIWMLLSVPLAYCTYFIPATDLRDYKWIVWLLNNDYIQWSTLIFWFLHSIFGFLFVSGITCERRNPFKGRHGDYRDLIQLIPVTLVIYFIGPVYTLIGSHLSICLFNCDVDTQSTLSKSLLFDGCLYSWSFLLGLHFTYPDHFEFTRNMGDKCVVPSKWKTYTRTELIAVLIAIQLVGLLIFFHLLLLIVDGLWLYYTLIYGLALIIIIIISYRLRDTHEVHVHHYLFGILLIPLTRYPNPISAVTQAVVAGLSVEGIARWGMDGLWDQIESTEV